MAFKLPTVANSDELSSAVPIRKIRLRDLVHTPRTDLMVSREQYYVCSQNDTKEFDIDGNFIRFGKQTDIPSLGYVPLKRRKPSARMDVPKIITNEFTAMVFGLDKFPKLIIQGDPDAEDFAQELAKQSKLPLRMMEARSKGGSQGTAVLSWGFVNGKPMVEVHNAAHCEVLEWTDYDQRKPGIVLKVYTYQRKVWDNDGKPSLKTYYYARFWDSNLDVCWQDIPEEIAATNQWWKHPSKLVEHNAGFCPVYWVQNFPKSDELDGVPDYDESSHDNFDQMDMLLSMTCRGTTASVDPTVVVHAPPESNDGFVRTGTGRAIYSEKGAEYLELQGPGIMAARELLKDLKQIEYDKAGVVVLDQEKAGGSAISAAAMRQRYARMLVKSDVYREQYGAAIVEIIKDMLEVARSLSVVKQDKDKIKYWQKVILPDRVEFEEIEEEPKENEEGDNEEDSVIERKERKAKMIERKPGKSSNIELKWPPYFAPTWADKKEAVEATSQATGKKQLVSQRTGVGAIGPLFGSHDVDMELGEIDADTERTMKRTQTMMENGGPNPQLQGEKPEKPEKPPFKKETPPKVNNGKPGTS